MPRDAGIIVQTLHSKHDLLRLACAAAARVVDAAADGGAALARRLRSRGNPAGTCPAGPGDAAGAAANNGAATDRATGCTHGSSGTDTDTDPGDGHHAASAADRPAAHGHGSSGADTGSGRGHRAATATDCPASHGHGSATTDAGSADGHHATATPDRPTAHGHGSATTATDPGDGHHAAASTHRATGAHCPAADGDQSSGAGSIAVQGRRPGPHAGWLRALGRGQRAGDVDRLLGLLVTALCPLRVSGRAGNHR